MSIISLTTDFGLHDWYVGTMKGVLLGIQPDARIVDICHAVAPGSVLQGAFTLACAAPYFPEGSVHVAVVDPGVGGTRRALAVQTRRAFFVGPDNGVLALALAQEDAVKAVALQNNSFFLPSVSRTFHGRDVFAPVAAHLSRGVPLEDLGPAVSDWVRLELPEPVLEHGSWCGTILYLDRFGNAITSFREGHQALPMAGKTFVLAGHSEMPIPVRRFYQDAPAGSTLALVGSSGHLEIAVNGGNAAESLALRIGDPVRVRANASKL